MNTNTAFTQFTLSGQDCQQRNYPIDECKNFCGGPAYAEVTYEFNGTYVFNVFSDEFCEKPSTSQDPVPFTCDKGAGTIGSFQVACTESVKIIDFTQFEIIGANSTVCSNTNKTNVELNTCGSICGLNTKITQNDKNVNGYSIHLFSKEDTKCATETDSMNFMCEPNKEAVKVGDYLNVVCSEKSSDSSSSTLAYSLALLASAALFNLLF